MNNDKRVVAEAQRHLREMKKLAVPDSFGLVYETADTFSETETIYNLTITCLVKNNA